LKTLTRKPHSLAALALLVCLAAFARPAQAMLIRGIGTGALVGGDLTDPENDINDNVPLNPNGGSGFNWVASIATSSNFFTPGKSPGEGALDLFDNKVGAGEAKWYDGSVLPSPGYRVAVQFPVQYALTRFTVASANDVPSRDPDIWRIIASDDGLTWVTIFAQSNDGVSVWGATRLQVNQWDVGTDFPGQRGYLWYGIEVTSVVSGSDPQLSEVEFFGTLAPEPASLVLLGAGVAAVVRRRRARR